MPKDKHFPHPPDWEDRIAKALSDLALNPSLSINKAAACNLIPPRTLSYRKNKGGQNPKLAHAEDCILTPL